jgi:SAM-dependent methyltransferase
LLTDQRDKWLEDTRRFWDAGTVFEAKYRRICSDPEIDTTSDEGVLEALWSKRTTEELGCLLDGIPIAPDWTCLEIGCGLGRLLRPIAQRCRRVIGIDLSHEMIRYGREHLRDVPNVELHVNDGRTMPMVPDGSVDLVYSHLAFQHMTLYEIVEGYVAEIARVLKPNGYCRIQCWREAPMPAVQRLKNVARAMLGMERYHGPRCWTWAPGREVRFGGVTFHPRQWRGLLGRYGLRVTQTDLGLGHDYWMWTTSRRSPDGAAGP